MRKAYAFHKPAPALNGKLAIIRSEFSRLHDMLEANIPASRELSVALTNLEQAAMWAIKATVINDPDSEALNADVGE